MDRIRRDCRRQDMVTVNTIKHVVGTGLRAHLNASNSVVLFGQSRNMSHVNSDTAGFHGDAATASTLATRQRWFTYLLIIAVAAVNGLADIVSRGVMHPPSTGFSLPNPLQSPIFGANDRSRWCTVWSLVERGTYQIDDIVQLPEWDTIDKGRFRDHFYSSKPPFVATIVAGPYYLLKRWGGFDLLMKPHRTAPVILLIVNWVPWVISVLLMAAMIDRYARSDASRIFTVVAATGGTFLTTFLVTLNNHTLAACGVVFALYPLLRILNDDRRPAGFLFAMAGFWGAFAVCCELPAAPFGVALFALLARRDPWQTCKCFVPAAAVPLAFFFYTNWLCTGGLMPFYANFGSPDDTFYRYVHEGVPSYWMNPSRVDLGESSALAYLFHCTIGHHGMFSLSPIFLLTIAGWSRLAKAPPLLTVSWLGLLLTAWGITFCLLQTKSYNYGGVTSGLRWTFWLIPFWILAIVPAFDEWGERPAFRSLAVILLALSVFSAACPRNNPWTHPWLVNVWGGVPENP